MEGLCTTLTTLVDYKGERLIGQALIPGVLATARLTPPPSSFSLSKFAWTISNLSLLYRMIDRVRTRLLACSSES